MQKPHILHHLLRFRYSYFDGHFEGYTFMNHCLVFLLMVKSYSNNFLNKTTTTTTTKGYSFPIIVKPSIFIINTGYGGHIGSRDFFRFLKRSKYFKCSYWYYVHVIWRA